MSLPSQGRVTRIVIDDRQPLASATGRVFGRIVNRTGVDSQRLIVQTNPVPCLPASPDTTQARLVTRTGELQDGTALGEAVVPAGDWAWATRAAANAVAKGFLLQADADALIAAADASLVLR